MVNKAERDKIVEERNAEADYTQALEDAKQGKFAFSKNGLTFTFNYKDGTKTVFLSELNCTPSGSDLKCLGAPKSGIYAK